MSSKVQNQNRTFIGKDNFSCSFSCYIKAMDTIMFSVNTVCDSLLKALLWKKFVFSDVFSMRPTNKIVQKIICKSLFLLGAVSDLLINGKGFVNV